MNKRLVEAQKNIESENEININDTIDFMSLHINGQMTKEYLKFIREVRKLKKKINKKKTKLAENELLEESYQKKEGIVEEYFKKMADGYKKLNQSSNCFRKTDLYDGRYNNPASYDEVWLNMFTIVEGIDASAQEREYLDQKLIDRNDHGIVFNKTRKEITEHDIKVREEIIQKHYDSINAYIMGQVLCYYDSELDFWKDCLKQLEKLDDIREFE